MRKISYKFSHAGLKAMWAVSLSFICELQTSHYSPDKLLHILLIKLSVRLRNHLDFTFDSKNIQFLPEEVYALKIAWGNSLIDLPIYEKTIISQFISDTGSKL